MLDEKLYSPIKDSLEQRFRNAGFRDIYLEITADGNFSRKLRDIFTLELRFMGRRFAPDLTGYARKSEQLYRITVEIKNKGLGFRELFQAKGYGELLDTKYAFLIGSHPLFSTVREFLGQRRSLLYFGHPQTRVLHIGRFNVRSNRLVDEDWFPASPF